MNFAGKRPSPLLSEVTAEDGRSGGPNNSATLIAELAAQPAHSLEVISTLGLLEKNGKLSDDRAESTIQSNAAFQIGTLERHRIRRLLCRSDALVSAI